jgi:exonuclease SbcC
MRIKSIKIKEFGRHALLDLNIDAGVIGVVGVNGCGKSTLLKAIEFAFTGLLEDAAETYVRNVGTPDAASNASIELSFIKNGIEGRIFRQIGKTTKRLLTWNGTEYKSAADVESCLREIIGADKQALSNAVFISQGELDRLLFGSQVEREQLFVKLLLLSHLEKISETVIKDQIKSLLGGTTKFEAVMEEIATQESEAAATVLSLKETLKTSPDHSKSLQEASELLESVKTLEHLNNQLADALRNKREAETKRQSSLGAAGFKGLDAIEKEIENQSALIASLEQKMQSAVGRAELEERARIAKESLAAHQAQLEAERLARQKALQNQLPEETRKSLLELLEKHSLYTRLNSESEQLAAQLQPLAIQEDELRKQVLEEQSEEAQKALADKKERLKKQDADIANLELKIAVLKPTLKSAPLGVGYTECPICGTSLKPGFLTEEKLTKLKSDLDAKIEARDKLRKEIEEIDTKFRNISGQLAITGAQVKQINNRLLEVVSQMEEIEAVVNNFDINAAKEKLSAHEKAVIELSIHTEQRLADLQSQIESTKSQLDSLEKELAETPAIEQSTQDEIKQKIANTREKLEKASQLRKVVMAFEATIETSEKSIEQLTKSIAVIAKAKDQQRDALFKSISKPENYQDNAEFVQAIVAQLNSMQQKRAILEGQLKQATDALNAIIERRKDIEARIAKEQFKKDLARQLELLSNTFNRKGLPLKYVNYRFAQLAELTAANLSKLGANFTVIPDDEKSVSFKFKRLDSAEEFYMGQEKLSGGQRVRLTVAFLLAVQQLIIPDVGLLILDEPSVHLDQEGTESLAEMLASMGEQLHDSEAQVIVCDHNTALEPAFQKLVKLGN